MFFVFLNLIIVFFLVVKICGLHHFLPFLYLHLHYLLNFTFFKKKFDESRFSGHESELSFFLFLILDGVIIVNNIYTKITLNVRFTVSYSFIILYLLIIPYSFIHHLSFILFNTRKSYQTTVLSHILYKFLSGCPWYHKYYLVLLSLNNGVVRINISKAPSVVWIFIYFY